MKRFLLVEDQSGGCDYTIGCGTRVTEFEAADMAAAIAYLRHNAEHDDCDETGGELFDDDRVTEAQLYEIADSQQLSLAAWKAEAAPEPEASATVEHDHERALYELLRKKFEPKREPPGLESVGTCVARVVGPHVRWKP
jgi:hypothetical protein